MDTTSNRHAFPARRSAFALAAAFAIATLSAPAFADGTSPAPIATDSALAAGQFEWTPDVSATGPVTIVVSLPAQEAHVYRGDVRIGRSSISSGKPGHDTPPGTYEILQKNRVHHSNIYDNAPMPYMQRLTWDGIALHAGHVTGAPASHGCVRLPMAFAEQLFEVTEKGGRVIVADETNASQAVLYPGDRVPVDPWTGQERGMSTASLGAGPATQAIESAPALAGN